MTAKEALRDIFDMMDEGLLVRNIERDHLPTFHADALRFTLRIKRAYDTLSDANGAATTAETADEVPSLLFQIASLESTIRDQAREISFYLKQISNASNLDIADANTVETSNQK